MSLSKENMTNAYSGRRKQNIPPESFVQYWVYWFIMPSNHHGFGTQPTLPDLQTEYTWTTSSTTRSPMGHMFLLQLMTPETALSQAIGGANPPNSGYSWGKGCFKRWDRLGWWGAARGEIGGHKSRQETAALVWASMRSRKPPSGRLFKLTLVEWRAVMVSMVDAGVHKRIQRAKPINRHVVLPLYI